MIIKTIRVEVGLDAPTRDLVTRTLDVIEAGANATVEAMKSELGALTERLRVSESALKKSITLEKKET